MQYTSVIVLVLMTLFAGSLQAEGNSEAGQALYATCSACHGIQGQGNVTLNAPG